MTTSYKVETEPGDLSPPLVSEDAAHDWAASNRRGDAYRIHVTEDGEPVGEPQEFDPRPT
ncbi:hypothetical protein PO878_05570 [Iamia majanohamensis]|uniref:Uncharacterized protein n=1 Tax=Iamia majanohamensis TaxID=467976 RepID=A0AAE9YBR4_9ACTN|nr:hypothetical protein [Iamia majanohamensis]WCO68193.1 hypothetical protein PO878_05570 [Iamia majanohamensis]